METKNNSQNEESSQEDSDILANAKGYFNKYFNQLNEWNDFKKNDFNKKIIKMIFIQQLPFLYNFFRNNYTDDKGLFILSDLLLRKYDYYNEKFNENNFNINFLKFKIGMNIWRLIINQNDEPLMNELQGQLNELKEEEEIDFISKYLCKIPLLYIIKDKLLSLLKRIEISKKEQDHIRKLITNEYEDTTTIKKRKISQIIPNEDSKKENKKIHSQNILNDMKKPKISTGINARLSFSQPFTFVTSTMNHQEKKKKENKVSIIDRFFEKCIEKSKMKVPIEKPVHKETTKSKIRRIIGNNFYGGDENNTSKYLPGKKEEEKIESKYNILNNKKKKKKMKKSSSDKDIILAYKTPRTVDVIEDAIEKSRNQKVTTSAAKRLFYNLLKQNNK